MNDTHAIPDQTRHQDLYNTQTYSDLAKSEWLFVHYAAE